MKTCEFCGVTNKRVYTYKGIMNLCDRHASQMDNHGRLFQYTIYDKSNHLEVYDDHAEVLLIGQFSITKGWAKIDLDDIEKIKDHKWSFATSGYTSTGKASNRLYMHRFIMNPPSNMQVDHINGDKLDNRKSNLRVCTVQQNRFNSKLSSRNKSGKTGVYYARKEQKWVAQIKVNKKCKYLGSFSFFEDAAKVRIAAENKYFGEFAYKEGKK